MYIPLAVDTLVMVKGWAESRRGIIIINGEINSNWSGCWWLYTVKMCDNTIIHNLSGEYLKELLPYQNGGTK